MKDLDRSKKYYIKNLNEVQKKELLEWLLKNCRSWSKSLFDWTNVIIYSDVIKEWLSIKNYDNIFNIVDAKVLFEIKNKIE